MNRLQHQPTPLSGPATQTVVIHSLKAVITFTLFLAGAMCFHIAQLFHSFCSSFSFTFLPHKRFYVYDF